MIDSMERPGRDLQEDAPESERTRSLRHLTLEPAECFSASVPAFRYGDVDKQSYKGWKCLEGRSEKVLPALINTI